ncbi:hypothetical protein MIMGU_mgv1a0211152mg, partial [Erythranthe guttata]
ARQLSINGPPGVLEGLSAMADIHDGNV